MWFQFFRIADVWGRIVALCILLLTALILPLSLTSALASPQRIASVNLCADQMLIALAPANAIVALGPFARDPSMSFFAAKAHRFPQLTGRSEFIIGLQLDAVAVGPFDNRFMRAMFARRQIPEIIVERWTKLSQVRSGITEFAERLLQQESGKRLVDEIDKAVSELRGSVDMKPGPTFLLLERRGFVGESGIVSELLEIAGMRDAAKGAPPSFRSVESVIAMRPDFLVLAEANPKADDRGLEALLHPALRRLYPENRRIVGPEPLTACSGPATPALIAHLTSELKRLAGRK